MSSVSVINKLNRKKFLYNCESYIIRVNQEGQMFSPWLSQFEMFSDLLRTQYSKFAKMSTNNVLVCTVRFYHRVKLVFVCKTPNYGEYSKMQLQRISSLINHQSRFFRQLQNTGYGSKLVKDLFIDTRNFKIRCVYCEYDSDDLSPFKTFSNFKGKFYLDVDSLF